MSMTDPIADMLTRIRNALRAGHPRGEIPPSRLKEGLAQILKREGYVEAVAVNRPPQGFPVIRIALKYTSDGESVVSGLERVSRPGRRVYCAKDAIPPVLGGLGISV